MSRGKPVDVHAKLAELQELVAKAKAMPLSASCLVNRADVLARIAEIEAALPRQLSQAESVLADADAVVAEAREQAVAVLAEAAVERDRRLELTPEGSEAVAWAAQIRAEGEADATTRTTEADDYVDSRLAHFEVILEKTLELARRAPEDPSADPTAHLAELSSSLARTLTAVRRGRDRLDGKHHMEELGEHLRELEEHPLGADEDAPDPLRDPLPER
ncbi:hypothetical protein [Sporichthya sp.]|uniref:hypothetical protein n=1 Tax=Sporichthya sp. TaxID=65475 RepID=UPI001794406A|nr:hypothetical protein [Sporichthya sp.]MBA3745014.1 hypothetical protein [Sporichthya sp.]